MADRQEIIVNVKGGLIESITGVPLGAVVVVRDYDVEGDEKAAELDENDEPCIVSFWLPT